MKYEEKPGIANYRRLSDLTKQVLSVPKSEVNKKLDDEKREKRAPKPKRKVSI